MADPIKVLISGCYDVLHGGHVEFWRLARKFGDHLTICVASDEVLWLAKRRKPSMPLENKIKLIQSVRYVDEVITSSDLDPVLDFKTHIEKGNFDYLVIEDGDVHKEAKTNLCMVYGVKVISIPRQIVADTSTTSILAGIKGVNEVPLRIDFAGGWLDVPKYARHGAYIVNCTITPKVSLTNWPYGKGGGLGGSAAFSILQAKNGIATEIDMGVGWQDAAVIEETGLCVWRSGEKPVLHMKTNPDWLPPMTLVWTGKSHTTAEYVDNVRDYDLIEEAGRIAKMAVENKASLALELAVKKSYEAQLKEGMEPLEDRGIACKYLGGGWGGYALYMGETEGIKIKPYIK